MAKILVVDDASLIRIVAQRALEEAGHDPILASNGEEGLLMLEKYQIDLILSDVCMPVMNGLEMVKNIKQHPQHRFIPIVMLTTESAPSLRQQGKELGVKAWLLKPFNKERYLFAITKLLG